jgi:hypothetical protein
MPQKQEKLRILRQQAKQVWLPKSARQAGIPRELAVLQR